MTLPINLSTGPVAVSANVMQALAAPPISHRCAAFRNLYDETTAKLCRYFNVRQTYLLTGSGTLANECMLQEIKQLGEPGLILSNGEFGNRLMQQATQSGISFAALQLQWGEVFDLEQIEQLLTAQHSRWILFCHCETSTGVINDLHSLIALCNLHGCLCFVDCMSTVGTAPLDLGGVTMATASSGKGLASVPGIGIVLSNRQSSLKTATPIYLDLAHYDASHGIPFTISSNLVHALYISICQKLTLPQFELQQEYGEKIYNILNGYNRIPFGSAHSKVFTIVPGKQNDTARTKVSAAASLMLSTESDYLKSRGWQQLAMFGFFTKSQLAMVVKCLRSKDFMLQQS